jgi:hypothetical protein
MSSEPYEVKLDESVEEEKEITPTNEVNDFNAKINQLSEDDHKRIVKDLMNGKEYKHFELKHFKNGNVRLIRKKEPSKIQEISERTKQANPKDQNKVYMTDQQLLWEHVIEMNKEIERLRHKNKKRKKEVGEIVNEMYYNVDDDEDDEEQQNEENNDQNPKQSIKPPSTQSVRNVVPNWRSRLKYLP